LKVPQKIQSSTALVAESPNKLEEIDFSPVQIGVCCMSKKLKSKPMQNILGALGKYREL
jgi:hypothetical protein